MNSRQRFFPPLPLEQWPALDRRLWGAALNDDPLESGGLGGAARWRPATQRHVEIGYGVWLAWLKVEKQLDEAVAPDHRASPERLKAYLSDMRWSGLSEHSCASRLGGLSSALKAMCPGCDSKRIGRAAGRVRAGASRTRSVSADREELRILDACAFGLMKEGDDEAASPLERALRYRDGLLLALLLHRPLRVSNLAAIRIDRHLIASGAGYSLHFESSEMKSHRPYECSVPQRLVRPLRRYLSDFRPVLAASDMPASVSDELWIGLGGAPLKQDSVAAVVRRRTRAALAAGIGPHRVRHMVAP